METKDVLLKDFITDGVIITKENDFDIGFFKIDNDKYNKYYLKIRYMVDMDGGPVYRFIDKVTHGIDMNVFDENNTMKLVNVKDYEKMTYKRIKCTFRELMNIARNYNNFFIEKDVNSKSLRVYVIYGFVWFRKVYFILPGFGDFKVITLNIDNSEYEPNVSTIPNMVELDDTKLSCFQLSMNFAGKVPIDTVIRDVRSALIEIRNY